ncbi:MAG: iron complex transport system substrate-binding protein [Ilumatobacter sp.]|jgi:iron complex transport system substrate-binding protein
MKRTASLLLAGTVAFAACGSDDASPGAIGETSAGIEASSSTAPSPPDTSSATAPPPAESSGPGDARAADAAFPVTIDHKFGSTTIEAEPTRVVSVGFNEHDFLLALGVVPVGLRDWYGDQPNGVWPWAQDELGDAAPEVLSSNSLTYEQIAALNPDLIVGVWSGMTDEEYELLSEIAPTVAQPDMYDDYGTPWQEQTEILGRATGRSDVAADVVAGIEERFDDIRDEHPEWEGQTASVAFVTEDGPGAYTSQDTRSRIMIDLGFSIPEINDSAPAGSFYLQLSPEDISPLDVDVLVWVAGSQEGLDSILTKLPTRVALDAVNEGREVFASIELGGAFSHGSPLSIEFALDELVPEINAAVDGDPATAVPSAVVVGAVDAGPAAPDADDDADADAGENGDVSAGGDEAAAATAAWSTVFDSTVDFADKAPFMAEADALSATAQAYTDAGAGFGGISLVPTDVVVDGESAEITYDVNFGENPAYGDQTGTITQVDGVWTVSRDEFCAFMSSARVAC